MERFSNQRIPPVDKLSTGQVAIPRSPRKNDAKIGSWAAMGIMFLKGFIPFAVESFCSSWVSCAISNISPLLLASVIFSWMACMAGMLLFMLAMFLCAITITGNISSLMQRVATAIV